MEIPSNEERITLASAINQSLEEAPEKPRSSVHGKCFGPAAFLPHFSLGLILRKPKNNFAHLPSGESLREAKVKVLEACPVHNSLEKR